MTQRGSMLSILFLFLCCAAGCNSNEQSATGSAIAIPDTSLSVRLDRWPSADDLAKLERLKGKGPAEIIKSIGHPNRLELDEVGASKWHYDWPAACYISLEDGVVVEWFYTAGY